MLKIPCTYMRAGTSRALFLEKKHVPDNSDDRNNLLMEVMGRERDRQIDGIGNGDPLSNKVAIVNKSNRKDADVDYLFLQILAGNNSVSEEANCGNVLAGVAPFAIDQGIVSAKSPKTEVRVYNINTDSVINVEVHTPNRRVAYEGDFHIDGVPGMGSPIILNFLDVVGKTYDSMLPTGNALDRLCGVEYSLVDIAIPVIMIDARAFGLTGKESKESIDMNATLLGDLRRIRKEIIRRNRLDDSVLIPKIALLSNGAKSGDISSRYFTPNACHAAHAITGALCIAGACFIEGTIPNKIYSPSGLSKLLRIEHPSGVLDVDVELVSKVPYQIKRVGFIRTARPLLTGYGVVIR